MKLLLTEMRACSCAFLLAHLSMQLSAQALAGSIGGIATDASGAAISEVIVTVSSNALIGGGRKAVTDANGNYEFLELPPGSYQVQFQKPGFKATLAEGVALNTGTRVTANGRLEVGEMTQRVTVQAQAGAIDTGHVTAQTVAGQAVMEGIPTGRAPWSISNTVPGVVPAAYDVGGSTSTQAATLTVHGSNISDQKFLIDGINVTWPGGGGGFTAMYYDVGMFQEINYVTGGHPADIANGGVYMNLITKDGGNQIHGTFFANGASEGMQSNNINAALTHQLTLNIPSALQTLPEKLGNPVTETYDYSAQVGGPILKNKLWWFTSWRLWTTNNLVTGGFNPSGAQALNDNLIANEMAKFSYQPTAGNHFSLMYTRNQKNRYHRRGTSPAFQPDDTAVLQNQLGYNVHLKHTYVLSDKWVIDSGVALVKLRFPLRYEPDVDADDISVQDTAASVLYNAPASASMNFTGRVAVDSSASHVAANRSGQHTIRFGVQYTYDFFNYRYSANGDRQGNLINGVPSTATLYNTPISLQRNLEDTTAFYLMDGWRINRHLTLNLGLRWEWMLGTIPEQNAPAGTFVAARHYAEIHDVPNFRNWTPRLGLSYDVTGHGNTVIRASFNKYMQGMATNLLQAVNPLQFFASGVTVPWNCAGPACIANGPQLGQLDLSGFDGFRATAIQLDPNIRRPYSLEESLGVHQQLPLDVVVSVTGWHRATMDAIGRANLAVPASAYTPITIQVPAGMPLAGQSFVVYNQSNATRGQFDYQVTNSRLLNTDYRGIDLMARRQMTRRWMLLAGLTLGRDRGASRGDIQGGLDDLNNPNNNFNRLGLIGDDTPVELKVAGIYNFPWRVELSGNFQHSSGFPLSGILTVTSAMLPAGQTLTQSSQSLYVAPQGAVRLPSVNLVDLRVSRLFTVGDHWTFRPEFDIYNALNAATMTGENTSVNAGSLYLNPQTILPPRLFKVGLKVDF
jgi:TonB dependent receptor/Carboxypeptidase regulatory-like domain